MASQRNSVTTRGSNYSETIMQTHDLPQQTISAIPMTSYGATLCGPDLAEFRIWAPNARRVDLVVNGTEIIPMTQLGGGWFETSVRCGAGTRYLYRLDDQLDVLDPASRAQERDAHSASIVVDPNSYRWRDAGWTGRPWEETVFYELHVGACGGFSGVIERLPALARLGITAIELMPVATFPGRCNWGYDGVLQFAPEKTYGTPDELKALVDTAHGLGMMVFLDVVYNHLGPDCNYLCSYARAFFRGDVDTRWGAAIDFRRAEVKEFFVQNALYWINEFHFDGLRLHALHAIAEHDWLPELATDIQSRMTPGRNIHLVMQHEDNAAHLLPSCSNAQWNDDGHHALHVMLTGETHGYYAYYADNTAAKLARCLEQGFIYQGAPSPHRNGAPRGKPSRHLPPTAFVLFLQNHDQIGNRAFGERLTTLARPSALRAAMALLLLSPQIPLLFMGEPVGATEPPRYFTDYEDEQLAATVREGRRGEFAAFVEFEDKEKRNCIPDPNDAGTFDASIPATLADPDLDDEHQSWLAWTSSLLKVRHAEIIPRLAGCSATSARAMSKKAISACWRLGDGTTLEIAVNLGSHPVSYDRNGKANSTRLLFETVGAGLEASSGTLPGDAVVAYLSLDQPQT
jgi:maltooligosyltrehalose trehalohydrolase